MHFHSADLAPQFTPEEAKTGTRGALKTLLVASKPLQTQKWLLICHSKVVGSCGLIIVWVICSGAPPPLASVCGSLCQRLPGTGMDGNIKQAGRNRRIRAAAVHWHHTRLDVLIPDLTVLLIHMRETGLLQVHGPQFCKYGSITQSSLVSDLQASLSRINLETVYNLHHRKSKI